ncbi:insulin-like growth factor-binding protein 2-A [Megalops cyprinoides]|uniref:insulin-like growth factor-binding protein 2-A n=1 Tax=Megalops cyprinoides TaxID=118141 RepID=UPI001864109A|nr:insulin-like growth factor-binding protein 2-A [Megalops cyprinoides]
MVSYLVCSLLLASIAFPGTSFGEVVFRCPSCTAERQAACPKLTETCAEIVREPGCGCCPVCARQEGESCGVYTPRCSSGLRCYPKPDSDLPLEQLVQGLGRCGRKVDVELAGSPQPIGEVVPSEVSLTESPPLRKPSKDGPLMGAKETAMRQHRQEMKLKMKCNKADEAKSPRFTLSQCQQELDQVLERISKMPFSDNRGPLEDLYALHIPNCDKRGQYNLKQCKMSVHGQRGECWCVNPHTGRQIPASPTVRGDPNCSQYLNSPETEPPTAPQK